MRDKLYELSNRCSSFPQFLCFGALQRIKQFLLLSKRRSALIMQCLIDSETSKPNFMPRLYINRRLAMEHRDNPSLDSSCKNTVFTQVRDGLPELLYHLSIAKVKLLHLYAITIKCRDSQIERISSTESLLVVVAWW